MMLSKKQKAIIWAMVLLIVVALGMEGRTKQPEYQRFTGKVLVSGYRYYGLYGITLYRKPLYANDFWPYALLAYHKLPLIIATLLIGIAALLTMGKPGARKGKKDKGAEA